MPTQHKYRPQRLALAIALALGFAELAIAQQPVAEPTPVPEKTPQALIKDFDAFIKGANPHTIKKAEDWSKLQLGEDDDFVRVLAPESFDGKADGGGGANAIQLDAAKGGKLGESRQFQRLDVKKGSWTLAGSGDFSTGALVRPKAMLTIDGSVTGGALVQGTLFNNANIGGDVAVLTEGTLRNMGNIAGGVKIYELANFSGKGSVGALDVHGHMVVNRAEGAPKVKGDMTLSSTAVLSYEVNPDGSSETIKVDGIARIDGATLKVVATNGEFAQSNQYTVIEAGKVEGTFGEVLTDLALMKASPQYNDGKTVGLTYARNEVPIKDLTSDKNSQKLGDSIEGLAANPTTQTSSNTSNAAVIALLGSNTATASLALELLAGDSTANLVKVTQASASPVSASMLLAMRQLDNAGDFSNKNNSPQLVGGVDSGRVWLQALGHGGKLDRDYEDLQHSTQGLVLGADWKIDENWRLGVTGGNSRTRLNGSELDGNFHSWHLGAYALRQDGPRSLRLGTLFSKHDGNSARQIVFTGFRDRPKGRYDATTQQAFAEVGYNLGRGNVSIEPFASLGYQRYQRDTFTEKGGDAALKVYGQIEENLSSTLGLRLARLNTLDNGMQLTPRFSAGWKHTYGETYSYTRLRLINGGKDFSVYGAPLDRDSVMLDAGLDLRVSANNTLGVGLTGEAGSDGRSYGVTGQWQMAF